MKKTFEQYPLDARIHEALKRLDYKEATEVQEKLIPLALEGRDAIVSSKTGSGKTASYLIPIINQIKETEKNPQLLIIVPTRELAVQVKEEIQWIGRYKKIQGIQIFGQQPMDAQILALKQRVHAIVATPGRLLDHIQRGNVQLHQIQYLVIDEADKLLEMGFIEQVESIILELPKERTTFMLSATIEPELERLCEQYMRNPLRLEFHEEIPRELKQHYYLIEEKEREASFLRLLYCLNPSRAIVFCNTQEKVDELHITMKTEGFRSVCLHGGLSQKERLRNIKEFKLGTVPYLIATDLAARGIHVDDVECVINYELPFQKENYVHRIGRSGRIDQEGLGISLVSTSDERQWELIRTWLQMKEEKDPVVFSIESKELPSEEQIKEIKINFKAKTAKKNLRMENSSRAIHEGIVRIRISAGKDKKIRALDVVGAISSIEGMKSDSIGVIEIQKTCSYVDIFDGLGDMVFEALHRTPIKGKIRLVKKVHPATRYQS